MSTCAIKLTVYFSGRDEHKLRKQSANENCVHLQLLIPPSASNDLSLTVLLADAGSDLRSLSVSLQRCFTLVDRGFTFKLISNYINMITATDSKVKTNFTGIEFRETALISKDASLIENPVRTIQ